ncbi:hypothetical protein G7Z17_g11584 [Cylindrodendrum hubeiense]|uniref:Uncharacterized protein n=1 Tax=Cylindrodendrum hubeiense TaxID=595255 RepID=A0A9P5L688_9HYPO|nr:hypothetical protein G7Z17_g11584 [Cylindrodendrum hubeiense]
MAVTRHRSLACAGQENLFTSRAQTEQAPHGQADVAQSKGKARPGAGAGVGAGVGATNRGFVDFSNRPHSPAGWIEDASVAPHAPKAPKRAKAVEARPRWVKTKGRGKFKTATSPEGAAILCATRQSKPRIYIRPRLRKDDMDDRYR